MHLLVALTLGLRVASAAPLAEGTFRPSVSPHGQSQPRITDCELLDIKDPRYFVNIVEREPKRTARLVYSARAARTAACEVGIDSASSASARPRSRTQINVADREVEISLRSRLEIDFDRAWIESQMNRRFEANVRMRARYTRGDKTQPLEIPSYFSTGVEAKPLTVRVSSIAPVNELLLSLTRVNSKITFEELRPAVELLQRQAQQDAALAQNEAQRRELDKIQSSIARITQRLDTLEGQRIAIQSDTGKEAAFVDSLAKVRAITDTTARRLLSDSLLLSSAFANAKRTRLARLNTVAALAIDSISLLTRQLRSVSQSRGTIPADTALARAKAGAMRVAKYADEIRAIVTSLSRLNPDSSAADLSLIIPESPDIIRVALRKLVEGAKAIELALADGRTPSEVLEAHTRNVTDQLALLTKPNGSGWQLMELARQRVGELRGAQIVIPATVLVDGDVVELSVRNADTPNPDALERVFIIRLTVRAFGTSIALRDAALLVKRMGVREADNARLVDDAQEQGKVSIRTEQPVNYRATPGASFTVAYLPRQRGAAVALIRWLQPAIGLHVSAPQFNATVTRFSGTERKEEQVVNELHLGTGAIVGLFNNRISFAVGRVLTAPERKNYVAIGFSFVSLANGAVSLAQATQ